MSSPFSNPDFAHHVLTNALDGVRAKLGVLMAQVELLKKEESVFVEALNLAHEASRIDPTLNTANPFSIANRFTISVEDATQIFNFWKESRKIEAIRTLRGCRGYTLKEAKDGLESFFGSRICA